MFLVACMPKSGSTYLTQLIAEMHDLKKTNLKDATGRNEQVISLPNVVDNFGHRVVDQVHCRATKPNLDIIRDYGLTVILVTRNLLDLVFSIFDHSHMENPRFNMAWMDERHLHLPLKTQMDLIIDLALPWYINFYVSWYEGMREVDVSWVCYEDLSSDTHAALKNLNHSIGKAVSDERILSIINELASKKSYRFNKGVCGRGENLSEDQKKRIKNFASYYPWVDFSPIGI